MRREVVWGTRKMCGWRDKMGGFGRKNGANFCRVVKNLYLCNLISVVRAGFWLVRLRLKR